MNNQQTFVDGLTDIFVKKNIITPEKAKAIKKIFWDRAKPQFVDFLLEEGLIDKSNILSALSEYYQVPAFDVVGYFFSHHYLHMFPEGILIRNIMIPLERDENILVMVVSDPDNPELLDKIGEHVSYDIQFQVGIAQDIIDAIREFYDLSIEQVDYDDEHLEDMRRERTVEGILIEDIED
jgi:type IV pilus assembly protein PilB